MEPDNNSIEIQIKTLANQAHKIIQKNLDKILELKQPKPRLVPILEKGQIADEIRACSKIIKEIQVEQSQLIERLMDKVPEVEKPALQKYVRERLGLDNGEKEKNDHKEYKLKPLEKGLSNVFNKRSEKERD